MNSSVSMTEVRSLLLIAEDEIDRSVKSIFEKLKTKMMEHGHILNKFAPAATPTHVTNAKYDGAIQYNGAVSYGLPPLYFMSTSSSCISPPLNTSGYAQQPPLSQFAAFSSQAFDCKSHIEDLKLVHKANNEKYEAKIDDAKRKIHLLTSTVEELKTELQNAKANWELKELQLVDFVKHLEEENSSMEKEISRLLNLLKSIEKEACAIKEEEARLKDSMKEIKSKVVNLQKALVEVKAANLKISGSIIDNESALKIVRHGNEEFHVREAVSHNENALRSIIHENEELHIKEAISHKKVEGDLRIYRGGAGNKLISTSNRNNYDHIVCVGILVSSAIISNAIRFAIGKRNNENDIASVALFILCWICNYMKNSSWRILYVLFWWSHSRAFVDHGLRKGLVKYTLCWILVLSTTFALIWNVMILIFKEKDITFYSKTDLSELLQNSWNVRVIKWPCFLLYNDLLLAFSQAKEVTTNSFNTLFDLVFMLSVCVFDRLARFFITS